MTTSSILETVVTEINTPITACVIWLHGLGADGHDFVDLCPQLNLPSHLGIRFIFPHAPVRTVTINNGLAMRAWYDIYALNTLSKEDQQGILLSQQAVAKIIAEQQALGIPASRIILAGFSQGGALALFAGLSFPQPLAGILGMSTYLPLAQSINQINKAQQSTPILITHGLYDQILPIALGEKSRNHLRQLGYPVEWRSYPMGHELCSQEIIDISQWLARIFHHQATTLGN